MRYCAIREWSIRKFRIKIKVFVTHESIMIYQRPLLSYLLAGSLLAGLCIGAQAQGLYRSVAPDGTVTYSDTPPAQARNVQPVNASTGEPSPAALPTQVDVAALPADVRQAFSTYPLTLYTTNNCAPCNDGRTLLQNRGLPYVEMTVNTTKDMQAFQQKTGTNNGGFPALTVGNKTLSNFNSAEWDNYLNAAGYPATSRLPASYQNPAPQPMTEPDDEATTPQAPLIIQPIRPDPASGNQPRLDPNDPRSQIRF
jgi:glutaredoxin